MKKASALTYFGSASKLARAIGVTRSAVQQWGDLVPPLSAAKLERASNGALKFDPDDYSGHYVTRGDASLIERAS